MSSTKRGGQKSEADFYPTPDWCPQRCLEALNLPGGDWLEPGAGDGALIKVVNKNRTDVKWTALELRPECRPLLEAITPKPEVIITDKFISDRFEKGNVIIGNVPEDQRPLHGRQFKVAFGNPPFSLAMEFLLESLKYAENVVFLLRLNFVGSEDRFQWMMEHMPDAYVLPNRPSFRGDGQTDSIEYAWFHWNRSNLLRRIGIWQMLALSSKEERRALNPRPRPPKKTKFTAEQVQEAIQLLQLQALSKGKES